MTYCLCCSNPLLRHIRKNQVFLFCRHCWQEMPERTEMTKGFPTIALSSQLVRQKLLNTNAISS